MMNRPLLKIGLPILVLAFGVGVVVLMALVRETPPRVERTPLGPLVEVMTARRDDVEVRVRGHGEVRAKVTVEVMPEVTGRVVEIHPALAAGGIFRAGEALLVIDPRDYELAVARSRAAVARAEVGLERERAEAQVARTEWEELHPRQEPPSSLTVREPQVRQAEAELEAAAADLAAARLALERTRLTLPFAGIVVSKSVDVGQHVAPGRAVATVYGTAAVEVRVPFEDRELAYFRIPNGGGEQGPAAEVASDFAGARHRWQGRVTRLEGQVDQSSRMVHVVVEVADPFARSEQRPPLLPGTFVEVTIAGRTLADVVPLPRHALREGDTVWVFEDGRLHFREVEVARRDHQLAWVGAGLDGGAQVITSALDAVTDGMAVRTAADPQPEGGER